MADFHFFTDTINQVSSTLGTYVSDTSTNIAGGFAGVATTLVTLYVVLWGWSMIRGVIQEPVIDGFQRIVRLAFIVGLATNIGLYNGYVSDFLWNTPDALASLIASGHSDSLTNANFLDVLWGKMYDFGKAFNEKGHASPGLFPDYGLIAAGWAVWFFGLTATVYAAFLLVLSKIALAVLLAVGPIFILATMFEGTKRFFDAWIGQAFNYVFLVMLTAATIKLLFTIIVMYLDAVFGTYAASGGADPNYSEIFRCWRLVVWDSSHWFRCPRLLRHWAAAWPYPRWVPCPGPMARPRAAYPLCVQPTCAGPTTGQGPMCVLPQTLPALWAVRP